MLEGLGEADHVLDMGDGWRMEVWRISPTEHVVVRNFSVSGRRTIDFHGVEGMEEVRRICAGEPRTRRFRSRRVGPLWICYGY